LKIFNSIQEFNTPAKTILTLGTFDGVHNGHKSLLKKLISGSNETGCESAVLTFFPHPRMVLQQAADVKLLNTMQEKAQLLEDFGIDNLIVHPFSVEFSRLTAEEFVKNILVDTLKICKIIIGHDHRFGRNRTATTTDLVRMGEQYGFEVEQITALEINETSVSSTKIRNALFEGNVDMANQYLGYPYFINGTVANGKQLGRTIGYPTANIEIPEIYKLVPAQGVYAVSTKLNGATVLGMMNIGTRPTVNGTDQTIEVNFFDFNKDIYGENIQVNIYHRLRSEQKFENLDALKMQLATDKVQALDYFKQNSL
jgi:riboflavin kinase/FMN adenylyltransferase